MLRDRGFRQPAPGVSPMADALKLAVFRTIKAIVNPLRKSEGFRRWIRGLVRGKDANYYYEAAKTQPQKAK
jgi:hypothetical protein